MQMIFTLWDVGHGLSIWIKTPKGHNHWIDAGGNDDFSPAKHVRDSYGEDSLDYLIISHPDADHLNDLPNVVQYLNEPRVLRRNKTLPNHEKYGSETLEYQKIFRSLDTRYTSSVAWGKNPKNPHFNGGIVIELKSLDYRNGIKSNNTSIVSFYFYAGWLFVCPGDIEDAGWIELWQNFSDVFTSLIEQSTSRILIAPHHGRESGYSEQMMENINPHLTIVSDEPGQSPTNRRFRENPLGISYNGEVTKYISTKRNGRIQFVVNENGSCNLDVI